MNYYPKSLIQAIVFFFYCFHCSSSKHKKTNLKGTLSPLHVNMRSFFDQVKEKLLKKIYTSLCIKPTHYLFFACYISGLQA